MADDIKLMYEKARKAFGENVELIHKTCADNDENTGTCDVYIAL